MKQLIKQYKELCEKSSESENESRFQLELLVLIGNILIFAEHKDHQINLMQSQINKLSKD